MFIIDIYKKYNFFRSQTALKDLENESTCPVRWKMQWFLKEIKFPETLPMKMGKYFEYLVIGSTAKGEVVNDSFFQRNKNGSKKVDQKRIEKQAEFAKKMLFDKEFKDFLGINIISTQEVVKFERNRIVIDIVGETNKNIILIDLKLTSNVSNTYGPYAWGSVSNMDLIQQGFYHMVYEAKNRPKKQIKDLLLVYDYSPDMGKVVIPVVLSESGRINIISRFKSMDDTIEHYETNGWTTNPSRKECEMCEVEDCPFRFSGTKVHYHEAVLI